MTRPCAPRLRNALPNSSVAESSSKLFTAWAASSSLGVTSDSAPEPTPRTVKAAPGRPPAAKANPKSGVDASSLSGEIWPKPIAVTAATANRYVWAGRKPRTTTLLAGASSTSFASCEVGESRRTTNTPITGMPPSSVGSDSERVALDEDTSATTGGSMVPGSVRLRVRAGADGSEKKDTGLASDTAAARKVYELAGRSP
mmetsp:Transcript_8914/g.34963  ORF Transcript_8914/g.34963 Transcript_8914/m.34963 type:complete len:200 (-) Transcript_8914:1654-2253(-)